MPDITASLEFLADIPLYDQEKPFLALLPPREGFNPDVERTDNLEWETHDNLTITDIRGREEEFTIDRCGFEVLSHTSQYLILDSSDALQAYRQETEELLQNKFEATHVVCFEHRLRENTPFSRSQFDLNDPFLVEGPAKGAHNDVTFSSGPQIIQRHLSAEEKERYLKPGNRFRIVNTWRTLVPVLEDRPLALCDFRSLDPDDLIPADRVLPNRVGEVYYVKFNKKQRWCWLERQKSDELFVFVMYDTQPGSQARYCPHVSFANSRASSDCVARQSIETRSIVISDM